ncbi:hypothetical protein NCC78_25370 [Micromonospora phytophila]|uniref:hypothetical protein n=1 Tax=Micromonospora phytophila TaxID=709888 RepID=UPI00202F2A39|nr:hypothetical protein [Micromonospora phytophila]MCM0677980.1 hypothetical protein [Micromonospora phytophila]
MLETALAKLLTLKVGAGLLAVTATGGVAVAAANGALPNPMVEPSASADADGKPAKDDKGKASPSAGKGSPSPSLTGLCRAYTAGAGSNPGKALENPAFTALITEAGDKEKVAAYCDALLANAGNKPTKLPSARPSIDAPRPSGKPTARPSVAGTRSTDAGTSRKPSTPTASPTN